MTKKTFIYTLSDTNNNIKYVGKSDYPNVRFKKHLIESKKNNTHKEKWINSLLQNNKLPILEIIDEVPNSEWEFWETFWIAQLKIWGFKLTNGTIGGEGSNGFQGRKHNKSTIEKLRNAGYKSTNKGLSGESNGRCKLLDTQITEIKNKIKLGVKRCVICEEYKIHRTHLYRILNGVRRKTHLIN